MPRFGEVFGGWMAIIILMFCLLGFVGYELVVSSDSPVPQIFGYKRIDFNKTGYVENINFLGGGIMNPRQTLIRFNNGDVVTLQCWETTIPLNQNITLRYYNNGFCLYFLENFTRGN